MNLRVHGVNEPATFKIVISGTQKMYLISYFMVPSMLSWCLSLCLAVATILLSRGTHCFANLMCFCEARGLDGVQGKIHASQRTCITSILHSGLDPV